MSLLTDEVTMDCKKAQQQIELYLADELDTDELEAYTNVLTPFCFAASIMFTVPRILFAQ